MNSAACRAAGLIFCASLAFSASAQSCGAARDLVYRALERVRVHNTDEQLRDTLPLLKLAVQECSELGDAWYYRSLFEQRLKDPLAARSLHQAELMGSEAMQHGANPFTLATPVDAAGQALTSKVREKWALVIGIGEFQSQSIPRLPVAAPDAESFAQLLRNKKIGRFQPDHVRLLIDKQATTVEVRKDLNWLAESAKPDDLVVVFISSHGSAREADTANVNYVLTYDTSVESKDDIYATALPMVEISNVVRSRIRALRTVVFLDTCHSGGATIEGLREATASTLVLDQIREGSGRAIIASSDVNESSQESEQLGHGYFTFNLLHALARDNGLQPMSKVFSYLKDTVPTQVSAEKGVKQNPVMAKSDRGADIVVGVETGR